MNNPSTTSKSTRKDHALAVALAAPPLSAEQLDRLCALIRTGANGRTDREPVVV